jgi:tricorn protease
LAYVWLPNTGKAATQISTVTILPKRKKGAIIDERFNHGDRLITFITDVSRDLLGYFNNPTGDQQVYGTKRGIWGPKVMIINEMAGSGDMLPYMFKMKDWPTGWYNNGRTWNLGCSKSY